MGRKKKKKCPSCNDAIGDLYIDADKGELICKECNSRFSPFCIYSTKEIVFLAGTLHEKEMQLFLSKLGFVRHDLHKTPIIYLVILLSLIVIPSILPIVVFTIRGEWFTSIASILALYALISVIIRHYRKEKNIKWEFKKGRNEELTSKLKGKLKGSCRKLKGSCRNY